MVGGAHDDARARVPAQGISGGAADPDRVDLGDGDGRDVDRLRARLPAPDRATAATTGGSRRSPCCIAVWAGDTFAYVGGRLLGRHKLRADDLAGQDVGGLRRSARSRPIFVAFVALYKQDYLTIAESIVARQRARRRRARSATSSSRCSSAT